MWMSVNMYACVYVCMNLSIYVGGGNCQMVVAVMVIVIVVVVLSVHACIYVCMCMYVCIYIYVCLWWLL